MTDPLVPLGESTGCQLTGGVRLLVLNKSRFEPDIDHDKSSVSPPTWTATRAGVEIVSTNQLELYAPPPTMNPRARTLTRAGTPKPLTRQPPATGKPAPALTQSSPSAEKSKLARETSGLVPPLSQVIVEPSLLKARLSVGVSVLLNRPIADRRCPPRIPNQPPARIFPSGCTASSNTVLSVGPGLKPLSSVPSGFSRAIIVRDCPAT